MYFFNVKTNALVESGLKEDEGKGIGYHFCVNVSTDYGQFLITLNINNQKTVEKC